MSDKADVVVVGAGQAGLSTSSQLAAAGIDHLVLERGSVGESWRSQRWDSFHLNTPNWSNGLVGTPFEPNDPDGFGHRDQLVSYFEDYTRTHDLPVRERTEVTAVRSSADGGFEIRFDGGAIHSRAVVLASGGMSRPKVPRLAQALPADILSLSAGTYRNADALPDGAVLVVGTGQSGCQIAEDLLRAGHRVYVCASRVGRVVRTYRGRDTLAWWRDMSFLETRPDDLEDPSVMHAVQPQVSGTDGGHTVSLQSLARDGATLLGRVLDVHGARLDVSTNLLECVAFGDEKAQFFKDMIDEYIAREDIDAPPARPDPGEPPLPDLHGSDQLDMLDLQRAGIRTIIWCTGFDADWSWVHADVLDERGHPLHTDGVSPCAGLYFIGFPWLSKRKSGILYGVCEDAQRIAGHIAENAL